MRSRRLFLTLTTLVALTGCARAGLQPPSTVVPAAVSCVDAPQLRQRAVDDRRKSDASKSDHDKIVMGNRAGFFASLANVADLTCKVKISEADEALKPAFEVARKAEVSRSTYERAQRWSEAAFIATGVISQLIQQLPSAPPRGAPAAH